MSQAEGGKTLCSWCHDAANVTRTVLLMIKRESDSLANHTSFSSPSYAIVAYGARPSLREWGERSG
eukprot:4351086-Pleurochrysis_carterae.AAC.1